MVPVDGRHYSPKSSALGAPAARGAGFRAWVGDTMGRRRETQRPRRRECPPGPVAEPRRADLQCQDLLVVVDQADIVTLDDFVVLVDLG